MTMTSSAQTPIFVTDTDLFRLQGMIRPFQVIGHPLRNYVCELQGELSRATVVPRDGVDRNVVTMNSRVRVRDQVTREVETFTIVYHEDSGVLDGKLSVLAPLGTALLGARVGDVINWRVPAGVRRLKVEQIEYQPEAAGDLHL
jgi:regulator of nucleoside diphosphate kinase